MGGGGGGGSDEEKPLGGGIIAFGVQRMAPDSQHCTPEAV